MVVVGDEPERIVGQGREREIGVVERRRERVDSGIVFDPAGEAEVQLDDLGRQTKDVAQAGEPRSDVVDGDSGAEGAELTESFDERGVVLDGLVLGELDDQPLGKRCSELEELRRHGDDRRDVDRERGLRRDPVDVAERFRDRGELEHLRHPDLARRREPVAGRPGRRVGEAGKSLVCDALLARELD